MADKTPTGTFEGPPAHAPREELKPLSPEAVAEMARKASQNERELAPLEPQGRRIPTAADAASTSPRGPQPAASDSDSPSRGIPRPPVDPNKAVTGGFGPAGEAEYFPLTGAELREVVRLLMDDLNTRIEDDLRFSVAITYPRVRVRIALEVEGWAEDAGFKIEHRAAPKEKTPIEVARAHGAEDMAFVVRASREEFDAEGNPQSPADRLRDELGLPKPRRQYVGTGTSRSLVDVVPGIDGSLL